LLTPASAWILCIAFVVFSKGFAQGEALDLEVQGVEPASPARLRFTTGHGLAVGQGRTSDQGLHAHDSLKISLRQYLGEGRIKEDFSILTNSNVAKQNLQADETGLTLQYRQNGFTLGSEFGMTYSSILYNKLSRSENVKASVTADFLYGLSIAKSFALDPDSSWEWTLGGGYNDYAGQFKTSNAYTSIDFIWQDFEILTEASGYRQIEKTSQGTNTCKKKSGRLCTDGSGLTGSSPVEAAGATVSVNGLGISMEGDWDNEAYLVSIKTGLDLQLGSAPTRIVSVGFGYAYSPFAWLALGFNVHREKNLDVSSLAVFQIAGASFSIKL
jgi:hypothetical protein